MSDYQPKVGDRVMVGEHGPYRVPWIDFARKEADLRTIPEGKHVAMSVPFSWLTPAPEPEPDEPTTAGALVRDGNGALYVKDGEGDRHWLLLSGDGIIGDWFRFADLTGDRSPVTVVLADPAEVEALRAERDELQRRIAVVTTDIYSFEQRSEIAALLRGES